MAPLNQSETDLREGMSDPLANSLSQLRQAVASSVFASDAPRIIRDYTDHGIEHVERVAGWANQLRQGHHGAALSEKERYLLLASIYMHDIGMQCDVKKFPQIKDKAVDLGAKFDVEFTANAASQYSLHEQMAIRNNHHLLSAAWISEARRTENIPLGLPIKSIPNDLVSDLMDVCMYHTKLSILDCPSEFKHDPAGRKQLVAALLRFADELDIDSRRVNIESVQAFSLDPQNSVYWWLHHNLRVFLSENRVVLITILLHPDDFRNYESLVNDNFIRRFKSKNELVMDVLYNYQYSVWLSYKSRVIEDEFTERLPVEITEVLDEMKAPRKPREEREATNLLKNADRLVKDLHELDNRWHNIMMELYSFDSSWPLERRDYVISRLRDFTGQEVILPTVRKTVAALEGQLPSLQELGLSSLADQSKELLDYSKEILRAIDRSRGTPVPEFDQLLRLLENVNTASTPPEVEAVKQEAEKLLEVFDRCTLAKLDEVFGKLEDHVTRIYPSISKPDPLKREKENLLTIRITLRRLLAITAKTHGIQLSRPTAGIMTMNETLERRGIIDETLKREIERIQAATFTAQWPDGEEADFEDLQFTLTNYEEVFAKLKERMRSTGPS